MLDNKQEMPSAQKNEVQLLVEQMKSEGKKIITFSLKQKYFDAIMAGRKVQEFREIRPSTIKRLVQLDEEGFDIEDENGFALPIKYDAILFYTGAYNVKHRDCALVEVTDAFVQYFVDDNGEVIEYQDDEGAYWQASQVVYNLGQIFAKVIYPKHSIKA